MDIARKEHAMVTPKYFEDYQIGDAFPSPGRTITEAHVIIHAGNTGDMFDLQMNAEYARTTPFGQRVVHGPLVYSIMEGLINLIPGLRSTKTNICYYGLDKMRIPRPVFIGDTISVVRRVIDKREKSDIGGLVKFEDVITNQRQEVVMVCETLIYVRYRNPEAFRGKGPTEKAGTRSASSCNPPEK